MPELSFDANNVEGQPMFQVLVKVKKLEAAGKRIIHFEIGDPDFSTPKQIADAGIKAIRAGDTHYVNSSGIAELRDEICRTVEKERNFLPAREQVVVTPGANSVIYFTIRCTVNRGEEVIVPDPVFTTYYSAIKFAGAKAVRIPLREENQFAMNPEEIRAAITDKTRMIVINSPNNPTGAVIKKQDIEEIAEIAAEKDLFILSDEIYIKMCYDGLAFSPAFKDQCRERTIILGGFSKSYAMSGWRIGYFVGPQKLAEKIGLTVETIVSCVPPFVQRAAIAALRSGPKDVKLMLSEFRKRRDLAVKELNTLPGVRCLTPPATFYVFPNITGAGMTSQQFADFVLEKAGVALLPGPNFGEHAEGFVRIALTQPIPVIKEAIEKMRAALEKR